MIRGPWQFGFGLALLSLGQPTEAAPLKFDCDAVGGGFSQLTQAAPNAPFKVSGRMTPLLSRRHDRWLPTATIRVQNADRTRVVMLRIMQQPSSAKSYDVEAINIENTTTKTAKLTSIELKQPLSFSVEVGSDRTRVVAGRFFANIPIVFTGGATVGVACSTGEFLFDELLLGGAG